MVSIITMWPIVIFKISFGFISTVFESCFARLIPLVSFHLFSFSRH